MSNSFRPGTINQVLDAYLAASEIPSREILSEWIHRYPQFERELIDITVAWIQMRTFPIAEHSNRKDNDQSIQLGMNVVRKMLDEEQASIENQVPQLRSIRSIFAKAFRQGTSRDKLASQLHFTTAVLDKINYHLVRYKSIPLHLIEAIADILNMDILSVAAYLQRPATIPQGVQFKSLQAPQVGSQDDFFDVIRNDPDLTDEQRQYWLMFEIHSQ